MAVLSVHAFPSPTAWSQACEELARELLEEASFDATPVDAFELARRLGIEVAFDAGQSSRGRLKRLSGRPTVFLAPDQRPERLQWAAAHELGEAFAVRIFQRLDIEPDENPVLREKAATAIAAAILLPRDSFFPEARQCGGDVPMLKRTFSTASHELILNRLLQLDSLSLISVFDHGQLTRRRTNGRLSPPPLMSVEQEAQRRAHTTGEPVVLQAGGLRVQAWAIHEPNWKRELLRTTSLDDDAVED
jgi:Zn-dependent peptidase ImmA (M78 family)